jgi:hypothetical protein
MVEENNKNETASYHCLINATASPRARPPARTRLQAKSGCCKICNDHSLTFAKAATILVAMDPQHL